MAQTKRAEIVVKGSVQGVFFRASSKNMADKLRLRGFVKNLDSGEVYVEAEGSEEALMKLIEWCKKGPSSAVVNEVSFELSDKLRNFQDFNINF